MSVVAVLVVMARAPRMGWVKTRLSADIGGVAATVFYRGCLARTVRVLGNDVRWRMVIAVTPAGMAVRAAWMGGGLVCAQGVGDLGVRMARVMERVGEGGGPVVVVGSDAPGVWRGHVAAAFGALGGAEAVFGPARDGGFWLAGFRRVGLARGVFCGVRWSTGFALGDVLVGLGGRRVAFLEELEDVDTGADYWRWRAGGGRIGRAGVVRG